MGSARVNRPLLIAALLFGVWVVLVAVFRPQFNATPIIIGSSAVVVVGSVAMLARSAWTTARPFVAGLAAILAGLGLACALRQSLDGAEVVAAVSLVCAALVNRQPTAR